MKHRYRVSKCSEEAITLIKKYESFKPTPYLCPSGKRTVGYGHVVISPVDDFDSPISERHAHMILMQDLKKVEKFLDEKLSSYSKQYALYDFRYKFDALCSLVYNWGIGNFAKSKGCYYLRNKDIQGHLDLARQEFFSKDKGVVNINKKFSQGLYNRRQAEEELWLRKVNY